jgi:hypothetical protein
MQQQSNVPREGESYDYEEFPVMQTRPACRNRHRSTETTEADELDSLGEEYNYLFDKKRVKLLFFETPFLH